MVNLFYSINPFYSILLISIRYLNIIWLYDSICMSKFQWHRWIYVVYFSFQEYMNIEYMNYLYYSSSFFQESGLEWPILRRWEVPWQWQTVSLTSLACGLGCVLNSCYVFIWCFIYYGITQIYLRKSHIETYFLYHQFVFLLLFHMVFTCYNLFISS